MLQYQKSPSLRSADAVDRVDRIGSSADHFSIYLGICVAALPRSRRRRGIAIVLGVMYLLTATPSYTASASMIIDTNKIQLFQQQSMFNDFPMDAGAVESQVEVLKSEIHRFSRYQAAASDGRS